MSTEIADSPSYHRDLGDGLLLRWSTLSDAENIVHLVGTVFRERADAPLNVPLGKLMRELMSGTHPMMGPNDFALVEDTRSPGNPLVACTCLWRQTWEYEGIPFMVGRPEIVASVSHLARFIRHIAPALERRLAHSVVAGYSGELIFNFYRAGLRMVFDRGTLTTVEDWLRPVWNVNPDGGFPPLVFLQVLFGYRSLDELRYAFPDVWVNDNVEVLVKTLFPSRPSWVLPLG